MKSFIVSLVSLVLVSVCTFAQSPRAVVVPSPLEPAKPKTSIVELGVVFPLKNSVVKEYITTRGITTLPLTSGYTSGAQIGVHNIIAAQSTVGVIAGANVFVGSDAVSTSQIYQLSLLMTGRHYFGSSWHGGFFAELGSGLEVSATKFTATPLALQINMATRIGAGYNYEFADDVTVGLSILASPSLSAGSLMDGARVAVSMLW